MTIVTTIVNNREESDAGRALLTWEVPTLRRLTAGSAETFSRALSDGTFTAS
jgi:hypothetical protein